MPLWMNDIWKKLHGENGEHEESGFYKNTIYCTKTYSISYIGLL